MASAISLSSCFTESAPRPEEPILSAEPESTGVRNVATSVQIYATSYKPKTYTGIADGAEAPTMVVTRPWIGAVSRHIAVYTKPYRKLYPSADILVMTTSLIDICFRSSKSKQKRPTSA